MESKSTRVVVAVYDLSPVTVHIRIEFVDGLVGQCVSLLHVDENKSQWSRVSDSGALCSGLVRKY